MNRSNEPVIHFFRKSFRRYFNKHKHMLIKKMLASINKIIVNNYKKNVY